MNSKLLFGISMVGQLIMFNSCRPCKSLIPNHQALQLPEGIGVYYPGQRLLKGQPMNGSLQESKREFFLTRKEPGGDLEISSSKKISGSLEAKITQLFKSDFAEGKIQSVTVQLNKIYKILGNQDEVFTAPNNALVIKNVMIADVDIKINAQDTTKLDLEYVQKKIEGEFKAKVSKTGDNKFNFKATDIVVALQSVYVKNKSEQEYQSTRPFILKNEDARIVSVIPPSKNFPRPTEILFNFPEKSSQEPTNLRKVRISFFGTGAVVPLDTTLNLSNLFPFSYIIAGTGKNSENQYIIFTFDFAKLPWNDFSATEKAGGGIPLKINVNRSMKIIENKASGLKTLCK